MAESSLHPITAVAGRPAELSHIIELQISVEDGGSPSTDYAFSASTREALIKASAFKATESQDGRPVVDPGSYIRAVLAEAADSGDDKTVYEKPEAFVLRAIVQSDIYRVEPLSTAMRQSEIKTPEDVALARIVASPDLTKMLAEAARLTAMVTPGQRRVDARHALVACLKTLPAQQTIWTDGLSTETTPSFVFERIRSALTETIEANAQQSSGVQERSDDLSAWMPEIGAIEALSELRLPESERRSDTRYVGDNPAKTLGEDRLGLATEVRALAEVMCLRDPGPPLAIGLFGDWGSGKSTYMNLIEAAIDELTLRTKADDTTRPLFVDNVVHIKFNAWHYNDADLWSSLTSQFFRQLRVGGHAERAKDDYSALVQEVAELVVKTEEAADAESKDLKEKHGAAKDLRNQIKALDRHSESLRAETFFEAAKAAVETFSRTKTEKERLSDLLGVLGYDVSAEDVSQSVDTLKLEAEKAVAAYGRASAIWRGLMNAMTGRGGGTTRKVYGSLAVGALLVSGFITLQALLPQVFGAGVAALLGLVSTLGVFGAVVTKIYKCIEPIFQMANGVALTLEAEKRKDKKERTKKSTELEKLEGEIAQIEEKRQILLSDAARFRGAGPEQVLDFFLRESETTRSFESSLGVVSHVRRAFEQLDAICREANRDNRPRPESAGFDRIVLYIDDLDRCRAQQVVEVLEAVHLLLAFPLFVVVVGVDARWLEQSLLEFYKEKLSDANGRELAPDSKDDKSKNSPTEGQATVHDFLEKIFQIPVRLRRLSAVPGDTFASYIRQAAGPVSYPDDQREGDGDKSDGKGRTEIRPLDVEIQPIEYAAGAAAEQVRLTRAEVEMIEKLGPVVGKTPRAVKRFVNLYRLMRGMRRGPDLDTFLGAKAQDGTVPLIKPYAAYQFWLAVDVGLPLEQARRLRSVVGKLKTSVEATALLEPVDMPNATETNTVLQLRQKPLSGSKPTYWNELLAFWTSIPPTSREDYYSALEFSMEKLPGSLGMEVLKSALEDTRRFSSDRF